MWPIMQKGTVWKLWKISTRVSLCSLTIVETFCYWQIFCVSSENSNQDVTLKLSNLIGLCLLRSQSAQSDHSRNFQLLADFLCLKWKFYLNKLSLWNYQPYQLVLASSSFLVTYRITGIFYCCKSLRIWAKNTWFKFLRFYFLLILNMRKKLQH